MDFSESKLPAPGEQTEAERAEMEWEAHFKAMKKALGWSHEDIAQFIGAEK